MLPTIIRHRNHVSPRNYWSDFFNNVPEFGSSYSTPEVNVEETKKEYLIDVAAPGLDKKDFKVNLDDNILTISSEIESKSEDKEDAYLRREFNYTTFSRSFNLPDDVNADKISAKHKNGILSISLPKSKQVEPKVKEIQIK